MGQKGRIKKNRDNVKGVAVKKKESIKYDNSEIVTKYYGSTCMVTYKKNNKKGRGQKT